MNRTLLAASVAVALSACASGGSPPSAAQLATAQATVAAVCSTEQVYADPKAADAAAKRCAAEQAVFTVLQVTAPAPAASGPH